MDKINEHFGITVTNEKRNGHFYGTENIEWVNIDKEYKNYKEFSKENIQKLIFKLRPLYSNNITNYEINKRIFSILVLLKNESMDIDDNTTNTNMSKAPNDSLRRMAFGHLAHKYSIPINGNSTMLILLPMFVSFIGNIPNKLVNSLHKWENAYNDLNTFYYTYINNKDYITKTEKLKTDLEEEIQKLLMQKSK